MATRCGIEFSESAQQDLRDVLDWHVSRDAPHVGMRLVAAVIERVEQLALFPDSGRIVPEFETPWLRELEMPPFRIVYRHRDERLVRIVRVWRSERLMTPDLPEDAQPALPADAGSR